jgi:hypothetical protein
MMSRDFEFDVDDLIIRRSKYAVTTDVYKMREFYSFVVDTFDHPDYLMYAIPLKALTPTYFEVINDWVVDSECFKYLCDGIVLVGNNDILLQNGHQSWVEKGILDLLKQHDISAAASTAVLPVPIIFITHGELDYMIHINESDIELMKQGQIGKKFDLHDPKVFNKILEAFKDGDQ